MRAIDVVRYGHGPSARSRHRRPWSLGSLCLLRCGGGLAERLWLLLVSGFDGFGGASVPQRVSIRRATRASLLSIFVVIYRISWVCGQGWSPANRLRRGESAATMNWVFGHAPASEDTLELDSLDRPSFASLILGRHAYNSAGASGAVRTSSWMSSSVGTPLGATPWNRVDSEIRGASSAGVGPLLVDYRVDVGLAVGPVQTTRSTSWPTRSPRRCTYHRREHDLRHDLFQASRRVEQSKASVRVPGGEARGTTDGADPAPRQQRQNNPPPPRTTTTTRPPSTTTTRHTSRFDVVDHNPRDIPRSTQPTTANGHDDTSPTPYHRPGAVRHRTAQVVGSVHCVSDAGCSTRWYCICA